MPKKKPAKTQSAEKKRTKPKTNRSLLSSRPRSFRQMAYRDPYFEQQSIGRKISGFFAKRTFLGISLGTGILLTILYSVAVAAGYYYYMYSKEISKPRQQEITQSVNGIQTMASGLSDDQRAQTALDALGKIFVIPTDKPTAIVVKDIDQAREQNPNFYKDARNGDWIFLFKSTSQAFLYRYEENILLNISAFTFVSPTPSTEMTPIPTPLGRD
jgi:hypothetical protein